MSYTKHVITAGTWSPWEGKTLTGLPMSFLVHMPTANPNGRKHAVCFYLHGIDHRGTPGDITTSLGIDRVATKGVPSQIVSGELPIMTRPGGISGQDDYKYCVIAAQCSNDFGTWPPAYFGEGCNFLANTFGSLVDMTRLCLFGYSLGAGGGFAIMGNEDLDAQVADYRLVAPGYTGASNFSDMADRCAPLTLYHCKNDALAPVSISDNFINNLMANNPISMPQYRRFENLPEPPVDTEHNKIIKEIIKLTPGTPLQLTNGDTWLQTMALREALQNTTIRKKRA